MACGGSFVWLLYHILFQKSFVPGKNLQGLANLEGFGAKLFWATIF